MKTIPLIIFILGLTSHCSISQIRLSDNNTFQQTFSQTEIQDLELLFEFFNKNICPDYKPENLIDCYNGFFKRIEQSEETGEIELNIPFENQKKIYDNFSDSTFQEIWSFGKSLNYEEVPHNNFKTVHLNLSGKYLKFLRKVGEDNKAIKSYFETIEAAGDITPSLVKGLLTSHSDYYIKDIRVIFIVAVHYLTLNDQFGRKERVK